MRVGVPCRRASVSYRLQWLGGYGDPVGDALRITGARGFWVKSKAASISAASVSRAVIDLTPKRSSTILSHDSNE